MFASALLLLIVFESLPFASVCIRRRDRPMVAGRRGARGRRMQGRLAGTAEYRRAAEYVAAAFKGAGLAPAGTDGYYQPVRFRLAAARSRRVDVGRRAGRPLHLVHRSATRRDRSALHAVGNRGRGPGLCRLRPVAARRPVTTTSRNSTCAAESWCTSPARPMASLPTCLRMRSRRRDDGRDWRRRARWASSPLGGAATAMCRGTASCTSRRIRRCAWRTSRWTTRAGSRSA